MLAVIISESWCLAEKAALKGIFRHVSLVITLNYYHSLNRGVMVCTCEYFEVCNKGKASGQNSELNTPLII